MTDEVLKFREGRIGRIRLNRPKALNALNTDMCVAMAMALEEWRGDLAVEAVLIDHEEGRGFCAGGDIRMVAESGKTDGVAARKFFFEEYRMNHALFTYAKPVVAVMDGITMGGGVGISLPAKVRIATENTKFAMPETGIGLFPDVGGGWYLSRLPGRMGQFLALTGHRLNGAECLALGLATHYLPAEVLDQAKQAIADNPQAIDAALESLAIEPLAAPILDRRADIDRLFASDTLEDIYAALEADGGAWAAEQLAILKTKSPQTMKVSLRLLHDGARMATFADEMRQEYAVATRVAQRHDFLEGVRAVIVDKDNVPKWNPATPEDVTEHVIDQIFAPLPDDEAWTPN
ncbi:MAG: enoyl-CoA hydratase/isomerase family protein [Sphingomonas sp.]